MIDKGYGVLALLTVALRPRAALALAVGQGEIRDAPFLVLVPLTAASVKERYFDARSYF